MTTALRNRMTYSNVIATLALFLALGGTSYAAVTISGKQVKDSSLTGRDVKNGSLTGSDLRKGTLKAGATGPAGAPGPRGATGATGAAGAPGATGATGPSDAFVYRTDSFDSVKTKSLSLPAGKYVVVARVTFASGGTEAKAVPCTLGSTKDDDPAHGDFSYAYVPPKIDANNASETSLSLNAGLNLSTAGQVDMTCSPPAASSMSLGRWSLSAVKVASLTG